MCGRYRLSRRKQIIEEHFASFSDEQEWEPRYNGAPTQSVPMPCYPPMARLARVQGTAKIKLVKTADGRVKSADAVEGSPLLTKAAIDNVRTWKFSAADHHDSLEPAIIVFEY